MGPFLFGLDVAMARTSATRRTVSTFKVLMHSEGVHVMMKPLTSASDEGGVWPPEPRKKPSKLERLFVVGAGD
jgi:hypothetical protein